MDPAAFYRNLPVLTTRRLILRSLRVDDAPLYHAFASDPEVVRFLRWEAHASLQVTEQYLAGAVELSRQGIDASWGITFMQDNRLIGTAHLMQLDLHNRKADVGVVLHRAYWGQGIGSEALRAVLALCFRELGLQRVQGLPIHDNAAACGMLKKCGMAYEGLVRRYALQKGRWWDFDLYSILPEEFHP